MAEYKIRAGVLIAPLILVSAPLTYAQLVLPGSSQISLTIGRTGVVLSNVNGSSHDSLPWDHSGQCAQDDLASGSITAAAGRGLSFVTGSVDSSLILPGGLRCDLVASGTASYTFQLQPIQIRPIPFFPTVGLDLPVLISFSTSTANPDTSAFAAAEFTITSPYTGALIYTFAAQNGVESEPILGGGGDANNEQFHWSWRLSSPYVFLNQSLTVRQSAGLELHSGHTGGSSGSATSDPRFSFDQAAFDKAMGTNTFRLADYFAIRLSADYRQVPRDLQGTGRSDALLYDPASGTTYAALSKSDASFQYVYNLFTPAFDTLRTGDFNGDLAADLVLYNSHTGLAYIGTSKGDGTFAFRPLFWSPGYDIVETGDINGDGKTDFVLYNSSTGTLYTALSKGDGSTFSYAYHLISKAFTFVRLADFTGDGNDDLLLYNSVDGSAFLGVSDGVGGFAFHPLSISPGYTLAGVDDLNGDNRADVILYNPLNGNAATGISDGAGGFTFKPLLFSPGFTSVRLADHTGDDRADLTVYNKNNGAAYFGTGNGDGTFNFQSLFWSPGYDYVIPQEGNGDGKVDVLLYNSATGTEYTGVSNGNGTFSYTYQYWGIGKMLAR